MSWILVTGGSSGIGASTVELLAERGSNVICADVNESSADALADKLNSRGLPGKVHPSYLDVTDDVSILRMFDDLKDAKILPTGLVNCAGINLRERAGQVTRNDWDRVIDVNLRGTFEVSNEFAARLIAGNQNGQIVNLASMLAHYGAPGLASYSASKGGVMALTRTLAVEWAPHGIRVNAVSPGYIMTAMAEQVLSSGAYAEQLLARTPMGRLGSVTDIAPVIAFLLSEESAFVTGQTLPVDGGITAGDLRLTPFAF